MNALEAIGVIRPLIRTIRDPVVAGSGISQIEVTGGRIFGWLFCSFWLWEDIEPQRTQRTQRTQRIRAFSCFRQSDFAPQYGMNGKRFA